MNTGVHTSHCCSKHGCKYGSENCPVELGLLVQGFPCEHCEEDPPLAKPFIHLNGSGKRNLRAGYMQVLASLHKVTLDIQSTAPHMRDYYPLKDAEVAFNEARNQHLARLEAINQLITDYEQLVEHVS